ncbi:MAG TPA: CmcJ/NvfI family oxidoreductase [Steroidobacteraceae bacterium]|nr:CmcJ/NvfI family oxidoreductase [Steroidobacteraceae bacterium]
MSAAAEDPGIDTVSAEIDYLSPGSSINRRFVAPGAEFNTGRYESHRVKIRNGRQALGKLSLDSVGFTLCSHRSSVRDFFDAQEVGRTYPSEVLEVVRQLTGAQRVLPLGWMVRTSGDRELLSRQTRGYGSGGGGVQPPASDVHVDMCTDRAQRLAQRLYREHAPRAAGYTRFIATSLWRTFSEPPQDWPLAVCDGTSLEPQEGVPNLMVIVDALPDPATMYAPLQAEADMPAASVFHFSARHRWWYFPNMTRDECILLKFHDSDHSRAWRAPHTAFRDASRPEAHIRRSIEFRTVAYFE